MTNEEVIEVLEKEESYMLSHGGVRQSKAIRIAINKIEQEPRWISVAERLPEESTAVLVWCPERKNIYCAYREVNQWWIFGAYFEKVTFKVTAWMPLPKQYKEEMRIKDDRNKRIRRKNIRIKDIVSRSRKIKFKR